MRLCKLLPAVGAFALFTVSGCTQPDGPTALTPVANEPKRIASVDVVKAVVHPVEITAGAAVETTIGLEIQSGYHVNANPPTFSYLIPTELVIAPAAGISAGAISYPTPINAKFGFSEKPLDVYEGRIEIKATLKAAKSAEPGQHSLSATLRVQACDNQVCYPPGTRELTIPVTIK